MRQIVVDHARRRASVKRGGVAEHTDVATLDLATATAEQALELDAALTALAGRDADLAQLVEWHFFAGLTFEEIAEELGRHERTVRRDWELARACLQQSMSAVGDVADGALAPRQGAVPAQPGVSPRRARTRGSPAAARDDATLRERSRSAVARASEARADLRERRQRSARQPDRQTRQIPRTCAGISASAPYRLLRLLGEGGMGQVFLAEREDGDFAQRVALKLHPRRFRQRRSCARASCASARFSRGSSHPHIAQLHDGGVADDGTPYFTLEYVDGEPITRWCDARRLDVRARLALMLQVCRRGRVRASQSRSCIAI